MISYDIFVFSFLGKQSSENLFMSPVLKPLKKNIRNTKGADIAITYAFATQNTQKWFIFFFRASLPVDSVQEIIGNHSDYILKSKTSTACTPL